MDPPQKSKTSPTPQSPSAATSAKSHPKALGPGRVSHPRRPSDTHDQIPTGRVRHDDRGNAVWDWLKETGRHAVESTSRLLKKLEMPQLKVEDKQDEELRIQSDRDPGGGYDPYNQSTKPPTGPPRKGR